MPLFPKHATSKLANHFVGHDYLIDSTYYNAFGHSCDISTTEQQITVCVTTCSSTV